MKALKATSRAPRNLPLHELVRRAQPIAQKMLVGGMNVVDRDDIEGDTLHERVAQLIGDEALANFGNSDAGREEYELLCRRVEGAVAIGIAIGLLLRPEAFDD